MSAKVKLPLALFLTLLVGVLAISNQSLWIDEGGAAIKAVQPTLGEWWNALLEERNSNLQLLLHLAYLWGWVKVFGASEIALRAANLPFLFVGLMGAAWGLQRWPARQIWFITLAAVNAFTWYYTNEARPYMLLFAASCWALACLARAYDDPAGCARERSWFITFCASLFFVSATSLVAVPWVAAWIVAGIFLLGWRAFVRLVREHLFVSALWLTAMTLLGGYYFWTLRIGAKPSDVGRTGLANLVFILYEQLGLAGLGPGRTDLRVGRIRSLMPHASLLALGVLALLLPAWRLTIELLGQRRNYRLLGLLIVGAFFPLLAVLTAGWLTDARILGRHLTPLYPVTIFAAAVAVERVLATKRRWAIGGVAALLALLGFSSLQIRFASRHARDDYRVAATLAKAEARAGKIVWWAADVSTGAYYAVRFVEAGAPDGVIALRNPRPEQLAALPAPAMIVLSKPDIHDDAGTLAEFAAAQGFRPTHRLAAFEILEPRS